MRTGECVGQSEAEPTTLSVISGDPSLRLRSHLVTYRARPDQELLKRAAGSEGVYLLH